MWTNRIIGSITRSMMPGLWHFLKDLERISLVWSSAQIAWSGLILGGPSTSRTTRTFYSAKILPFSIKIFGCSTKKLNTSWMDKSWMTRWHSSASLVLATPSSGNTVKTSRESSLELTCPFTWCNICKYLSFLESSTLTTQFLWQKLTTPCRILRS